MDFFKLSNRINTIEMMIVYIHLKNKMNQAGKGLDSAKSGVLMLLPAGGKAASFSDNIKQHSNRMKKTGNI